MAADFARDGVVAYAVAYVGRVTFTCSGCAPLAEPPSGRRRVVVIEVHDGRSSRLAVRDIITGSRPCLGSLQMSERASGRFGELLNRACAA
jgi:hypothetical protein